MGKVLQERLQTEKEFSTGEQIMLALGLATAELGKFAESVFRAHGLTHTQYNVLRMLRGAEESGLLHGDIAQRLIVGDPDVTRLADRLQEQGLVKRSRSQDDRRKVVHQITEKGLERLDQIQPEIDRFHAWVAKALEPTSRKRLIASCERLIEYAGNSDSSEMSA